MARKLDLQQAFNLLQSSNFYPSCDDESDFDKTQLNEPSSSEDSRDDDDTTDELEVGHKQENLSNVQESLYFNRFSMKSCDFVVVFNGKASRKGEFPEDDFPPKISSPKKAGPTAYSCWQVIKESLLSVF